MGVIARDMPTRIKKATARYQYRSHLSRFDFVLRVVNAVYKVSDERVRGGKGHTKNPGQAPWEKADDRGRRKFGSPLHASEGKGGKGEHRYQEGTYSGKTRVNTDPSPTVLDTSMRPPMLSMMPKQTESPSPVPAPGGLVV